MKHATSERGFVALMSVIIISAILLILLFTLGLSSFFARFDSLDTESKRVSLGYAEACVSDAMLRLAQNTSYAGNEQCDLNANCAASVSQAVCSICPISGAVNSKRIRARAQYGGAYTNLSLNFDATLGVYTISNWQELAKNPDSSCLTP